MERGRCNQVADRSQIHGEGSLVGVEPVRNEQRQNGTSIPSQLCMDEGGLVLRLRCGFYRLLRHPFTVAPWRDA